jgi:hypothetical protein
VSCDYEETFFILAHNHRRRRRRRLKHGNLTCFSSATMPLHILDSDCRKFGWTTKFPCGCPPNPSAGESVSLIDSAYYIHRADVGRMPVSDFFRQVHAKTCRKMASPPRPIKSEGGGRTATPSRSSSPQPRGMKVLKSCIEGGRGMFCCCVLFCV